ncbi:cupredoxin domain-containing protein [Moritella yayanosii]|uniref:Likely secreted protein containing plastocyanin domain n=1 Tax=Moritella yayanosii TaxID=69539 RepID=A0A330LP24_9GAMM
MIFINILGLGLIAFIVWWFWIDKPTDATELTEENSTIVVDSGIYQPARIKVPSGKKAIIAFLRKDDSPCAATVIFPDFEIYSFVTSC